MKLSDIYLEILTIVSDFGVSIDIPIESEEYFVNLVENYQGTREELLQYVRDNIHSWFKCIMNKPQWIQDPEWRFFNGKPMVFVGQVDIPRIKGPLHDDSSFYIFWDPETGVTDTVIQVA